MWISLIEVKEDIERLRIKIVQMNTTNSIELYDVADELERIYGDINQIKAESIRWTVDDFKQQAKDCGRMDEYDSNKFQNALELMIYKHDAMTGINLDTIRTYLDEYCLKNK